ncbi:hypothetical protein [Acanthopleuribacter pedis]|uniref:Uncharacterized protein n=1 Tax=Acanthopleuribacter pedis TaxID=442870 RepID=A0A8J7Q8K1_9BACT|nr:hypothetical protein [Acanthopleuribacter pedis]MBO1320491.1 hypothetical protein [Acanthopleuribacter pedis]
MQSPNNIHPPAASHQNRTVSLHFHENGASSVPAVTWRGRIFTDGVDAVAALHHSSHPLPEKLRIAAQIINHFTFAGEYRFIENPDAFKHEYQATYGPDDLRLQLAGRVFGPFDVSEIGDPQLRNGRLIFWVYARYTLVPFRVSVPYPLTSLLEELSYESLPQLRLDAS